MSPVTALRTDTLLAVENVSLSYGDKVVLRDVNVKIQDLVRPGVVTGQVCGLLAPSGLGKTTLARIIAGLLQPTTGNVFLGPARKPVVPGDVGVVDQEYIVFRHRDVLSNLEIAARRMKDPTQAAVDMLNSFGLLDKAHLYPAQLSGGQRQRIAIGQQLLSGSDVIIFDEPTAGLDPLAKAKVCALIGELACRSEIETVLLISHDVPSVVACCDSIWLMGRQPGLPGATIVETIDLVSDELCWTPDVQRLPRFTERVQQLQDRFKTL